MSLRGKRVTLLGTFTADGDQIAGALRAAGALVNHRLDDETQIAIVGRGVGFLRDAHRVGLELLREEDLDRVLAAAGHHGWEASASAGSAAEETFAAMLRGWTADERTALGQLAARDATKLAERLVEHPRRALRIAALGALERIGTIRPQLRQRLEARFDPNAALRSDASAAELLALASLLGASQRTETQGATAPRRCADARVERAYAFGLRGFHGPEILRDVAARSTNQLVEDRASPAEHLATLCGIGFAASPCAAWATIAAADAAADVEAVGRWLDAMAPELERLKPWELCFMYVDAVHADEGGATVGADFRKLSLRLVGKDGWLTFEDEGVELAYATRLRSHLDEPTRAARDYLEWAIVHYALARAVVPRRLSLLAGAGRSGRLVWLGHACGSPPGAGIVGTGRWDFAARSSRRDHVLGSVG